MRPVSAEADLRLRLAAFDHLRCMTQSKGKLDWNDIAAGFPVPGGSVHYATRPRGIFRPARLRHILSIKTVKPRLKRNIWYRDQQGSHKGAYGTDEEVEYAFMGSNPSSEPNQALLAACRERIPIIYFAGISPARYVALFPAFIFGWDPDSLTASVSFGQFDREEIIEPRDVIERRYATREVLQRLHQGTFREAVLEAYEGKCALSGFRKGRLLDAAHIIPDRERGGEPVVQNGLPLSKLHHAAFDRHLIGIDPNYRIHVSDHLLGQSNGPLLESLKNLNQGKLLLPKDSLDWPDPERLSERFEAFRRAA